MCYFTDAVRCIPGSQKGIGRVLWRTSNPGRVWVGVLGERAWEGSLLLRLRVTVLASAGPPGCYTSYLRRVGRGDIPEEHKVR